MFDEKNIYIKQAEIKSSFKQNATGTFLINELTVNSSLKNYKKTLHKAFDITMEELINRNKEFDCKEECKQRKGKKKDKGKNEEVKQ